MASFQHYLRNEQGSLSLTVDIIIFTVHAGHFSVLLVRRAGPPFRGRWAIPGGFLSHGETLEETARRELTEETGITGKVYLEQLYTFSDPRRDPRGRVISTAYFALVNADRVTLNAGSDAADAQWFPLHTLPKSLAFDHAKVLTYALKRLRWKIEYTNAAWSLLPPAFRLADLQTVYETILGRTLDKRNFRKRIRQIGMLRPTGGRLVGRHRPAGLYRFATKAPTIAEIL